MIVVSILTLRTVNSGSRMKTQC